MVFAVDPHIQHAKEHLDSGEVYRFRYACLELRLALERVAYQKLQLRLGDITVKEIAAWQPKRVMDALMELVDPELNQDFTLSMGARPGGGDPATDVFTPIGTNKGVNPKEIGKYWHKLGSNLHMVMPTKKGDHPKEPDEKMLSKFIEEVIFYVQEVTSTRFDAHFIEKVTFVCGECNQVIVRNQKILKEHDIVQCQNPVCDASYTTHKEGGQFLFKPRMISMECKKCGQMMHFGANKLLKMPYDCAFNVICACDARHHVRWAPQYGLLSNKSSA